MRRIAATLALLVAAGCSSPSPAHEPGSRAATKDGPVPVLVKTGFRASNAGELLQFADGAIVGSSLKTDGVTWNPVDQARVRELMDVVLEVR